MPPAKKPATPATSRTRDTALARAVDQVSAAVDRVSAAVEAATTLATKANELAIKAAELSEKVDGALFGRWDKEENREIPGFKQEVARINQNFKTLFWCLKYIGTPTAGFCLIAAVHSFGVPTEAIGQAIAQAIYSAATHAPPTP